MLLFVNLEGSLKGRGSDIRQSESFNVCEVSFFLQLCLFILSSCFGYDTDLLHVLSVILDLLASFIGPVLFYYH